ncbi:MAG: formylglycine-generating enzyme family protein, partial [Rhodospirillaceae bacterium]
QEALDLVKRWGADLSAEITGFVQASRQAARRRKFRLALAGVGAVLSLPVIAGLVWAVMVWQGVRAVEADLAFVRVPAGCFQMGSPDTEAGRSSDEGPVHEVCLKAFDLGKFELTQAQWKRVMVHVDNPSSWKDGNMGGDDQHPVEMVSWDDAQLFLRLMTFFGSHRYRLPSEAEWEYAARAGTRTSRYWGDDVDQGCPYANMADLDIKDAGGNSSAFANCRDGYIVTSPVGSLKPNGFGLHDMIGNVWEWVEDCYKNSYEHAPADGSATTTKDCKARVDRGGSWSGYPRNLRAACRSNSAPGIRSLSIGFRVVRTVTP